MSSSKSSRPPTSKADARPETNEGPDMEGSKGSSRVASPVRPSLRILAMVHELHSMGYERLRIAAGMSPSGCHWRCVITSADNVEANGWRPISADHVARYSSGSADCCFDWVDSKGKGAKQLALMFVERFPEIARHGLGPDPAYAAWFVGALKRARAGRFPIFFADYEITLAPENMPPSVSVR